MRAHHGTADSRRRSTGSTARSAGASGASSRPRPQITAAMNTCRGDMAIARAATPVAASSAPNIVARTIPTRGRQPEPTNGGNQKACVADHGQRPLIGPTRPACRHRANTLSACMSACTSYPGRSSMCVDLATPIHIQWIGQVSIDTATSWGAALDHAVPSAVFGLPLRSTRR